MVTREEILTAIAARSAEVTPIEVAEWGGTVYVKKMTAKDVERSGLMDGKRDTSAFTKVIISSICDADGKPMFKAQDEKALSEMDMVVVVKVFTKCLEANGLLDDELKELADSFEPARPADSSSD